jgi:hypothetical protein
MKRFIVISGVLLSLFGYGASGGSNSPAISSFIEGAGEARGLFMWALGLFGTVTGAALFFAIVSEKRRVRRELAFHNASLAKIKLSIRKEQGLTGRS